MDAFITGMHELWTFLTTPPFVHLFIFALILFAMGIVGRILSGFRISRTLTHTSVVCFTIIFVYVVSIVAFGENAHMQIFATALPYMNDIVDGTSLTLMLETNIPAFAAEMAQVFFLSVTISILKLIGNRFVQPFSWGLVTNILKAPLNFFRWYFIECFIVLIAMGANVGLDYVFTAILGSAFAKWLPIVVFSALVILMVIIALSKIIKTVTFFALPIWGKIWTFMGDNPVGKIIKGSFFTTLIIVGVLLILSAAGILWPLMTLVYPTIIFGTAFLLIVIIAYITWIFYR